MQELLGTKVYQLWLNGPKGYKPWRNYLYLDTDDGFGYSMALKTASYMTQKGYDVKLVTSTVTNVL